MVITGIIMWLLVNSQGPVGGGGQQLYPEREQCTSRAELFNKIHKRADFSCLQVITKFEQ